MFLNGNLKFLRKKSKLSYGKLSSLTGITINKLYRLENDESVDPQINDIRKLASFFGVTIDDLINTKFIE